MLDKTTTARRGIVWTPERNELLAQLWGEFTARRIAEHFGDVTKSAVIGQAHRLGLARDNDSFWSAADDAILRAMWMDCFSAQSIAEKISRRSASGGTLNHKSIHARARKLGLKKRESFVQRTPSTRQRKPRTQPETPLVDANIPLEQRKTLFELERHHCRWPVGEPGTPEFFFCGAPKSDESSYCPAHHFRAYNYVPAPRPAKPSSAVSRVFGKAA